jgi:hypothetical protein
MQTGCSNHHNPHSILYMTGNILQTNATTAPTAAAAAAAQRPDAAQRQRFVQLKAGSVYLQENSINHTEREQSKAPSGLM